MPNIIAYIALLSWPFITLFLIKKKGMENGILLALLGAYMFLPVDFKINLPGVPALDKFTITTATIIGYLFFHKKRLGFDALNTFMKVVFVLFLLTPFLTVLTNSERYYYLPGLKLYDGLSDAVSNFLMIIPFIFGVKYFNSYEKQALLFKYFVIAAVVYALLAMYEVRMSPQLHRQLYGYFPHSWLQQYREGGFRAIVFMGHGLLVALFLAVGVAMAVTMTKLKVKILRYRTSLLVVFILTALVLQKSLAALVFGLFALFVIYVMSSKRMHQLALVIGVLFLMYPMLSSFNMFPHKTLLDIATKIDPERAQSLGFRFEQEEALLSHANNKPLFGWGGWGRNRVRNDVTGSNVSTTDGRWIITLGVSGWVGYLSQFLLVVTPLWLSYRLSKKHKLKEKDAVFLMASHSIVVAVILLDQMPNSSLNSLYWLIIGSLLGRALVLNREYKQRLKNERESDTFQENIQLDRA
ncbi:hypothetical protein [Methylophaga sp.]|uniref:hypothetical protein n=1 Tax=Methylophaga sp. TaxID=2024840 RepID=UPI003A91ED9D